MLTAEEVSAAAGVPLVREEDVSQEDFTVIMNAGGLFCSWADWQGSGTHLVVTALPAAGIEGVDLAAVSSPWATPECGWYCATVDVVGDVAVVTTVNAAPASAAGDTPFDKVAGIGDRIAEAVAGSDAVAGAPWRRDRSGWKRVDDCATLGQRAGSALGFSVEGREGNLYIDPPLHGGLVADAASGMWVCMLSDADGDYVETWGYSGMAWMMPSLAAAGGARPAESLPDGWTGVMARSVRTDGTEGEGMVASDGVNLVHIAPVPDAFGADVDAVAAAVLTAFP